MQKIKTGDVVQVRSGKYRGKSGKVLKVFAKKSMVLVEKLNLLKRNTKPSQKNQAGGIVEKHLPLPLAKVALLDPKSGKPTRVGFKAGAEGLVRFAKKSGQELKV